MAAVAEYQRSNDTLLVTGAVDIATARALGVYQDAADETPTTAPATTVPRSRTPPPPCDAAEPTASDNARTLPWILITATLIVAPAAVVVGRRRYVVAQRSARRRLRVHPATSPGRSVADLRRAGEYATATRPARRPQTTVLTATKPTDATSH